MGRRTIERSARTAAAPRVVYALLRDGSTWPAWAPVTGVDLVPDGDGTRITWPVSFDGLPRHAPLV